MMTILKSFIQERLSNYEDDDSYLTAAALDPRFKLGWCDAEKRNKMQTALINKAPSVSLPSAEEKIKSPPAKAPKLDDDFFSFTGSDASAASSNATGVGSEIKDYLKQPCTDMISNPLEYWKGQQSNYPMLSTLASRYLTIQASSAPVERLFSIAGKIFRPDRCSVKDQTFERLMMIKCNAKLTDVE